MPFSAKIEKQQTKGTFIKGTLQVNDRFQTPLIVQRVVKEIILSPTIEAKHEGRNFGRTPLPRHPLAAQIYDPADMGDTAVVIAM